MIQWLTWAEMQNCGMKITTYFTSQITANILTTFWQGSLFKNVKKLDILNIPKTFRNNLMGIHNLMAMLAKHS